MKRLLTFAFIATLVASSLSAGINPYKWKFEPTIGGNINVKDAANAFNVNLKMGKGDMSGLIDLKIRGGFFGVRTAFVYDIPFYFTINKVDDFSVGPTFDIGPGFGFGGGVTSIDFIPIGLGVRTTYSVNKNFGLVFEPAHFTMSFVNWTSGGAGINTGFTMTYDVRAGVYFLF
jgi:hypothetical protein